MLKAILLQLILIGLFGNAAVAQVKAGNELNRKIAGIVKKMTLEEKISLLHGNTNFTIPAIEKYGIPSLTMSDGPHGVREDLDEKSWKPSGSTKDSSTYLPNLTSLAATWNTGLAYKFGTVIAEEAKFRGKDVMLGPGINIHRTPLGGRNFEYMGEDPFLISKMVVPVVKGIQYNGTISCVKHFALNNQEKNRFTVNVRADERTLREIYLPGFEAAVIEGGALAVMGAYNKFRGEYCCHNDYLLNVILKKEWGFKGVVISDWGGTHNTIEAARNGLDIEMGTEKEFDDFYMARPLIDAVRSGKIDESLIDEKVKRILYVNFKSKAGEKKGKKEINTPEHRQIALDIAKEGIVLLKNENNILPLDIRAVKSIAVIGDNADRKHAYAGGSSMIKTPFEITPLQALMEKYENGVEIKYAKGYSADSSVKAELFNQAVAVAKESDVVLFCGGLNHGFDDEGKDKKDLILPYGQDDLIKAIVNVNPRTIVVLISGSPVEVYQWVENVPAILQGWYNGMQGGRALISVLTGETNPSGKLPFTFPKRLSDSPEQVAGDYPGDNMTAEYKEGLLVGYRWYDTKDITPQFCFGHGLSYSSFRYSGMKVKTAYKNNLPLITVEASITNISPTPGKEVVQLYIKDCITELVRPEKELKGFMKIDLKPGETKRVIFNLDSKSLSYYAPDKKKWCYDKGEFSIQIGGSSRDIRLEKTIYVEKR